MNKNIRNFVIIAHIDHGKSTLADRFLEITNTISPRKMKEQYLDQLELERERGITIKMAPVRMQYKDTELNLIDTPGHSDFSYEVSRALRAVEGAILLVDATQGIQAQTLANLEEARTVGLKLIGALNKIDLNTPGIDELKRELAELIGVPQDEIHLVSAKRGDGVIGLLDAIVKDIPPPTIQKEKSALIFSSIYNEHKGIIAFSRVFGGDFSKEEEVKLQSLNKKFKVKEVGYFAPEFTLLQKLYAGEIGYIATGLKDPDSIRIGDTIGEVALPGFRVPQPVVFVSLYPGDAGGYEDLKTALFKLKLNDSSLTFEADSSPVLGKGFKCGFLGRLHFEVTIQRIEREFGLEVLNSFPSVAYRVFGKDGKEVVVENPKDLPDEYNSISEPYVKISILIPNRFMGKILELGKNFRFGVVETHSAGGKIRLLTEMPLSDLIMDFDDKLKSISNGFASFSYEIYGYRKTDVRKLDIVIADQLVSGLSRIIPKGDVYYEARKMAKKLKDLLPRKQFAQAIQAVSEGRIIARETIPALRKNVTGNLYGGDRTRKTKLWDKQRKGKKKLKERGRIEVPLEVFRELLKR